MFTSHPDLEFYCPKYVFVELFKHNEAIVEATKLEESDLLALLHTLIQHIHFLTRMR